LPYVGPALQTRPGPGRRRSEALACRGDRPRSLRPRDSGRDSRAD
jgi:hypothetical protein